MKFTNEQAVEALRAELTNKGRKSLAMSERTLAKTTESLIKRLADEEMGLPDFVGIAVEILNPVNDNIRKDKSDFANKWKEEHPETNPPENPEPPKPTENPEIKALMERIAALEADKAESVKKASIAQKRKDITAKLKEKGVRDDKWVESYLNKVNLTAETDVDAEVEDTLALYNLNKANGGNSIPPANPNGGNDNNQDSISDVSALAKQQRESLR